MTVSEIIADLKEKREEIREVVFVACGGSLAAMYPAKYLLESEASNLRVGYLSSNEFVHATPKYVGETTLVIATSHQGTTSETVEAARVASSRGAAVISIAFKPDSLLSEAGDYSLVYEYGPQARVSESKAALVMKIAFELLKVFESYEKETLVESSFEKLDVVVNKAKALVKRRAEQFAKDYKDEKNIYVMGSGSAYGAAYAYSICILMEMQWINSSSIHTGEFFHGPFEIVDYETPFILLMSEGRTRNLDERALRFLEKYARRFVVLDAKELGINLIDDSIVEFFNPLVFSNVLSVYSEELALERKHPLSRRRYMWKVEY